MFGLDSQYADTMSHAVLCREPVHAYIRTYIRVSIDSRDVSKVTHLSCDISFLLVPLCRVVEEITDLRYSVHFHAGGNDFHLTM